MKMSSIIISLVIIAGIFLLGVLIFLAYLNWSYKVQASLISIALVGTGTVLVTIFSGLKDQRVIERFVSTVIVNDTTVRFAAFPDEKSKIYGRSQMLNQYADQSTVGEKDGSLVFDKYPKLTNDDEWYDFNREAFAYDLLKYIGVLSSSGAAYDFSSGIANIGIQKIDLPTDCKLVNYKSIESKFEKFHGIEFERASGWLNVNVPAKTEIKMYSIKEKGHFPVSVLEFNKNLYFQIAFKVTRITDPNTNLPEKLLNPDIETTKLRAYSYSIEMVGEFSKYSSSGDKSSQYALWCNSLFAAVKQRYDNANL